MAKLIECDICGKQTYSLDEMRKVYFCSQVGDRVRQPLDVCEECVNYIMSLRYNADIEKEDDTDDNK